MIGELKNLPITFDHRVDHDFSAFAIRGLPRRVR